MKRSLPIVFMLAFLACVLFAGSCAQQSSTQGGPKQVVLNMLETVKKNDYNAVYDMLSSKDKKQISRQDWVTGNEQAPASVAAGNKNLTWKVTGEKINGKEAVVSVTLSQGSQSEVVTFGLVKEGNDWKVSLETSGNTTQ